MRALAELLPTGAVQREDAAAWVAFGAAASTRPWLADTYWEALQIMRTWVEGILTDARKAGRMRVDLSPAEGARLVTAVVNGLTLDLLNAPANRVRRGDRPAALGAGPDPARPVRPAEPTMAPSGVSAVGDLRTYLCCEDCVSLSMARF